MVQTKKQIRLSLKQKRSVLSDLEVRSLSETICDVLQKHLCFQNADKICLYYPLGKEVNLLPLASAALALGKQTAFPRVNGSELEFYQVQTLSEFVQGTFGVMEPVSSEKISAEHGLVLVPGLAFDTEGGRMGYGKGYYDRYFARYPECCKIGICYEMQLISKVPCDQHDVRMDGVATEQGLRDVF